MSVISKLIIVNVFYSRLSFTWEPYLRKLAVKQVLLLNSSPAKNAAAAEHSLASHTDAVAGDTAQAFLFEEMGSGYSGIQKRLDKFDP